jgi:hypothetical protein
MHCYLHVKGFEHNLFQLYHRSLSIFKALCILLSLQIHRIKHKGANLQTSKMLQRPT